VKKLNFKTEYLIILVVLLIKTALHLFADSNSGLDGDEIYHVNTGKHLAWGYMEFPPMIGFLAWIQNSFKSDSVFAHHFFVHIAASLIIIFCGLTVIRLGGKWKAVLLCLVCILTGSCFGLTQNAFQPVIFDQLFWILSFYFLISFIKTNKSLYLILVSVSIALGFLTKYSILFFAASLLFSIIAFQRGLFKDKLFWICITLIIAVVTPNIIWQWNNSFPVFAHFSRLYEVQLDKLGVFDNILALLLSPNPLTIFVWFSGIFIVPFGILLKNFRLGSFVILFSFILMFLAKGKFYYFYPIILMSFITGSVLLEHIMDSKKWIFYFYISLLILMIPITATSALPVFSLERYISIYKVKKNNAGVTPVMDSYSFKLIWENLTSSVKNVYDSIPAHEKENCLIWGDTYSWASAINFYSEKYQFPNAISFHGTHYLWITPFKKGITMIAICNSESKNNNEDRLNYYKQFFSEVELKNELFNPYTEDKTDYYINIFLCHDLKYDSEEMKKKLENRIFE
jgi:hypothetical protein